MKSYLETLIREKGVDLKDDINLEGHIGLTWQMLVDFISNTPVYQQQIRQTFTHRLDFRLQLLELL
jgi:hypothetical protein